MQTKLLVATEKDSSLTVRITPEQIGEFLGKCNKEQLKRSLSAMVEYIDTYGSDEHQIESMLYLLAAGEKTKELVSSKGDSE